MNNFQKISIPSFIGSLEKLTYLNLHGAAFSGMVPPHLGNLSNLRHLDLFAWSHARQSCQDSWVSNINWLSGLSSLEYLNLGCVNLGKATTDWMQAVNTIPSLVELTLLGCQLSTFPQSLPFVNLTSLSQYIFLGSANTFYWWRTTSYKIETKFWPNKNKKIFGCCRFCARLQLQYLTSKFKFQ